MSYYMKRHIMALATLIAMVGCDSAVDSEGQTAIREIGSEGGTISLGSMTVEVPQGALDEPVVITIEELPDDPEGAVSAIYLIEPTELVLTSPIIIEIALDPIEVAFIEDFPSGIYMAKLHGEKWLALDGSKVDTETLLVTAPTTSLGSFAVMHQPSCQPSCNGKVCGDNGCGGVCGVCNEFPGSMCTTDGTCSCTPSCVGRECGDDGCGGSCGTCTLQPGSQCNASGTCECVPACNGKSCGSDSCGGSCGACSEGHHCSPGGTCAPNGCDDGNSVLWDGVTEGAPSEFQVNTIWDGNQRYQAIATRDDGSFVMVWATQGMVAAEEFGTMDKAIVGQLFFADGTKDGGEFLVSSGTASDRNPTIAFLGGGGFVAVWVRENIGMGASYYLSGLDDTELRGQVFDAKGRKVGSELGLNQHPDINTFFVSTTTLADGSVLVVWDRSAPEETSDSGKQQMTVIRKFDANGTLEGDEALVPGSEHTAWDSPSAMALPDGGYVLYSTNNNLEQNHLQCFDATGAAVADKMAVSTNPIKRVDTTSDGTLVVVVQDEEDTTDLVLKQFDTSCTPVGQDISLGSIGYVFWDFLVLTDDRLLLIYDGYDGSDGSPDKTSVITARIHAMDGSIITEPFQINTYVAPANMFIDAEATGTGSFVVSWTSGIAITMPIDEIDKFTGQDGYGYGVFAQLFAPSGDKIFGDCCADGGDCSGIGCVCDRSDACDVGAPCSTDPCDCDMDDCGTGLAATCAADGTCDEWCPTGTDPDCLGTIRDGWYCFECGAGGLCTEACEATFGAADSDCIFCHCDNVPSQCEPEQPGTTNPCPCDVDCASSSPCSQDYYCDETCPSGVDPDCDLDCGGETSYDQITHVCQGSPLCDGQPMSCDLDCQSGLFDPCVEDNYCDPFCPLDTDPDCTADDPHNGAYCN